MILLHNSYVLYLNSSKLNDRNGKSLTAKNQIKHRWFEMMHKVMKFEGIYKLKLREIEAKFFKFQINLCDSVLQHFYNQLQMKENTQSHQTAKYDKLFTPQELNLLSYRQLIEADQFQYVYQPNDDTFLILSTLKHELPSFKDNIILCQIGSGSGIISANLHHWLCLDNKEPLAHISIDLNMDASLLSKRYFDKFNLNIQQINTSIFNNLIFTSKQSTFKPQIIVFNPPYVPVEQEEIDNQHKYLVEKLKYVRQKNRCIRNKQQNLIAYSYMGGLDGLKITRKILGKINWTCTVYFIVMGQEGLKSIEEQLISKKVVNETIDSANFELLQYHQFWNEHLYVVKTHLKAHQ